MNVNKWKIVSLLIEIIGCILILSSNKYNSIAILYIGISVLVLGIVIEVKKWRCPYCKKTFFRKGKFIIKCPYCNRNIQF